MSERKPKILMAVSAIILAIFTIIALGLFGVFNTSNTTSPLVVVQNGYRAPADSNSVTLISNQAELFNAVKSPILENANVIRNFRLTQDIIVNLTAEDFAGGANTWFMTQNTGARLRTFGVVGFMAVGTR